MTRYALIAALLAVIGLGGALALSERSRGALRDDVAALREDLRLEEARAAAATKAAARARFAHQIAVIALQDAERDRADRAAIIEDWRNAHGETLDERAPDALLDLVDRLRAAGGEGGDPGADAD